MNSTSVFSPGLFDLGLLSMGMDCKITREGGVQDHDGACRRCRKRGCGYVVTARGSARARDVDPGRKNGGV